MIALLTGIGAFILGALGVLAGIIALAALIAAIVWAFENEVIDSLIILGLIGLFIWTFYKAAMGIGYWILAVIT